jgi:hypothetical protein
MEAHAIGLWAHQPTMAPWAGQGACQAGGRALALGGVAARGENAAQAFGYTKGIHYSRAIYMPRGRGREGREGRARTLTSDKTLTVVSVCAQYKCLDTMLCRIHGRG